MATKTKSQEKNKMSEIDDQILKYFEIKKRLGKGAYGIVWKAIDKKNKEVVAVKKIFDAFRNETDAQRTFREIMFLRAFRNHPNVIQLHSIYRATNNLDIYLSFEFMESDLHNVIKRGTILKDVHKRYVMYQLFNAVKYIHSGNVIHRDLKPSNVLIDSKCRCKIADFGLARSVSQRQLRNPSASIESEEPMLTDYVATRWYRAPEILVASKRYTKGIDMWSLGCILGEMIRGKPLFPGSSTVNQIEKIISALPEVTEKDVAAVGAGFGSVLLNQQINTNGAQKLDDLLVGAPNEARTLIKCLLVLDPSGRLTAKQALSHKYIEKFRNTIPESELNTDVLPPFRDDVQLTVPEYRSKLYEIVQSTDKCGNSIKVKKREPNTIIKLDSTITVIPSGNSSNSRRNLKKTSSKLEDPDKGDIILTKQYEKKAAPFPSNFGPIQSTPIIASRSTRSHLTNYVPTQQTSASAIDQKLQTMSKVKYCKISNVFDSSKINSAASSERAENHGSRTVLLNQNSFSIAKRHSIDCGYATAEAITQTLSGKNQIHSNSKLNNFRTLKHSKINKNEEACETPSNNKYIRKCFTPDEGIASSSQKTDRTPEKMSNVKMTKAEILAMSNDSGSYYERRLKNLEEKIQRHKMDIKAMLAQNPKHKAVKVETDIKQKIVHPIFSSSEKFTKGKIPLTRSKSENSSSKKIGPPIKYDYTFPEGDRLSSKRRGSDYSVITAKGIFDITKAQVIT